MALAAAWQAARLSAELLLSITAPTSLMMTFNARTRHLASPVLGFALASTAIAQNNITWAEFVEDNSKIPATNVVLNDDEERDYDYADLDKDGWTDLVIMRKQPFTTSGRRTNVLLMNESGTLVDRTTQYASASDVPGDNGFDTATNDRDVVIADINGDTWLDVITAVTLGNGQTKAISHPRIYINLGESGGSWQGLEYQEGRIPQLLLSGGGNAIPFFCGVDAGDVDGDGDLDLYFSDYDVAGNPDVNDRLLLNNGSGFFTDESFTARVTTAMLASPFGTSVNLEDMNGDGAIDIVKNTGVGQTTGSARVDISYNNPSNEGFFNLLQTALQTTPYHVDTGDLNQDGLLDFAASDDGPDRYLINQGNDGLGRVNWSAAQTFNTDDGFGSNVIIEDLNNDDWPEVLICDVDVDIPGFGRRLHIYHNRGGAIGGIPDLNEESGGGDTGVTGMGTSDMGATHDVAVFDLDNDGDKDMIIARDAGTQVWINQLDPGPASGITIACDPATNNDSGLPAKLDTSFLGSPVGSGLSLRCHDGPANQFGFFLVSSDGAQNLAVFNGVLCLGAPSGRYTSNVAVNQGLPQLNSIGQFDSFGNLVNLAGTAITTLGFDVPTELPLTPAGQTITPGSTWYFQCWFRDSVISPGDSANFSNMLCVTFP